MIKIYIPICNSASFLERVEIPAPFDVTVVDAASTDNSVAVAEARGWNVAKRAEKAGRVENWGHAVRHFVHSQAPWCKWLFTGDKLYPHAHEILMQGILSAPEAKLVICEYDIVEKDKRTRWKIFPETRLLSPPETSRLTAEKGNWFGSPIGQTFHRDAVAEGFDFGAWTWAADMQFCYTIAKKWPVLYLAESIGEFHVQSRKTFSSQCNALGSSVEEYLVRTQAANDYLRLTEDTKGFEILSEQIVKETEACVVARAFNRSMQKQDTDHILRAIPMKKLFGSVYRRCVGQLRSDE